MFDLSAAREFLISKLTLLDPCALVELVVSSWKSGRHKLNLVDLDVNLEQFFQACFDPGFFFTIDNFLRSWSDFSYLLQIAFLA